MFRYYTPKYIIYSIFSVDPAAQFYQVVFGASWVKILKRFRVLISNTARHRYWSDPAIPRVREIIF
jgi:hypothetical protein